MFLITARFRPSRSHTDNRKQGIVYYRIVGQGPSGDCARQERSINSDIHGSDDDILQAERERILSQLRLLYCVIERRADTYEPYNIDDIAGDFRKALAGDASMSEVISRSRTDIPFRSDLVSVGREFRSAFRYVYTDRGDYSASLSDYVFRLSQTYRNERRISQSRNYLSLLSSLRDYSGNRKVCFSEIDPEYVQCYARWLGHTGISESTQSFYLRTLRAVLNKAHKEGIIEEIPDWFGTVNTRIYRSDNIGDKSLSIEILRKIERADLSADESLTLVRDMFMFGFYCGGMELVDIAHLTDVNIRNGYLVYHRRQKGQERNVALGDYARAVLMRYAIEGRRYLFPLLDKAGDVMFGTIRNYVGQCIKSIGKAVGYPGLTFSMNISTYKTLASGISIPEILLEHGNVV